MAIFKRYLQRLWHSSKGVRLVQCLIAVSFAAVVFGTILTVKKSSPPEQKISCVKDRKVILSLNFPEAGPDLISIPLIHAASYDKIPFLEFVSNDQKWKTTALYAESIGDLMAELSLGHSIDSTPLIAFVQDASGDEYFIMVGKNGESSISSIQFLLGQSQIKRKESGTQKYLGLKIPFLSNGEDRIAFYIQQQAP